MAFDGLMLAAVIRELRETMVGGRIEKIYQPAPQEIVMLIHRERNKYRLLVSANARDARIHLTYSAKENPTYPPMFCMVLRKHLVGGKVLSIEQDGLERVAVITIEAMDELGRLAKKMLVCEIMGKHSNIILTDPESNIILDGIKRYSYGTSRHREVLPGRVYNAPPPAGKLNPVTTTEDTFRNAIWNPDLEIAVESALLAKFEGFSPQTCREICFRAGLEPFVSNQILGEIELQKLWQVFREISCKVESGGLTPSVCLKRNVPAAFSAIPLEHILTDCCRSGTASAILDEFFTSLEHREQLNKANDTLTRIVKNEIKKSKKKISIHEETLRKAEDAEKLKATGELITSNIYQIKHGSKTAELIDYYDPEAKTVKIQLDPQLSPAENAQVFFKRYTKARNSKSVAIKHLEETKTELNYLESVITALNQAESMNDLQEIKAELTKEGYIKTVPGPRAGKTATAAEPLPMSLNSSDGFEILVGRNNRQNDYLTMKLARPEDIWLHVKDIPGSHVIVRNPAAKELPERTLQEAAEIAAYYSRARESSKVPVDYTLRKAVRKPKGAKPGMVIYDNQRTVIVEPKTP